MLPGLDVVEVESRNGPPLGAPADGPWRTVVQVTRNPPRGFAFWARARVVVAVGAPAGAVVESLSPGQVAVFRDRAAETVRPDISPGENALLTPGRARSRRGRGAE